MPSDILRAVCATAHTRMVLPGELPRAWSSMPLQTLDISNNSLNCERPR